MKRQRRKVGDIVAVALGDGTTAYGHVLFEPLMAFYSLTSVGDAPPSIDEVTASPVLFRICVMSNAVKSGLWPVVGNKEPLPEVAAHPKFFMQDSLSGALSITTDGSDEVPASFADCERLECAAVWDPEHVVERISDELAGRPNKWVKLMRPQPVATAR